MHLLLLAVIVVLVIVIIRCGRVEGLIAVIPADTDVKYRAPAGTAIYPEKLPQDVKTTVVTTASQLPNSVAGVVNGTHLHVQTLAQPHANIDVTTRRDKVLSDYKNMEASTYKQFLDASRADKLSKVRDYVLVQKKGPVKSGPGNMGHRAKLVHDDHFDRELSAVIYNEIQSDGPY